MIKSIVIAIAILCLVACDIPLSEHPLKPASLGEAISTAQMLNAFETRRAVTLQKVKVADWAFRRGYVDPAETEATGEISIHKEDYSHEVYIYALRHPTRGLFLIDAGFSNNYEDTYGYLLKGSVRHEDRKLVVHLSTIDWLSKNGGEDLRGVFLTHLHFDHMQGVADLDPAIPVYVGTGAGSDTHIYHRMIAEPTAFALRNHPPLEEWRFDAPEPNKLAAVDVFGDGTLFALHAPGHTSGSTAYLVNAVDGAHLITGDAVYTTEGWTGPTRDAVAVEPNLDQLWANIDRMRTLASEIDRITIHPGHQSF